MPRSSRSSLLFQIFRTTIRRSRAPVFCAALCGLCAHPLLATKLSTTTVLTVSPSTVAAQKPVTLTATVMAGSAPATPGQVVFCVATVEVTGHLPSVATVSTSGSAGNYTLTSAVAAYGIVPPTGTVSFNDATTLTTVAMAVLDSTAFSVGFAPATLYSIGLGFGIFDVKTIAVGDFNGDGYLDVAIANPDISGVTVLLGDPDHPEQFTARETTRPASIPLPLRWRTSEGTAYWIS